ncbi:MAG: ribonuclease P protein component [Flavobacteriales bacterium]|nr:ribonuclease P protein component [Flavobacteriales bacterium]
MRSTLAKGEKLSSQKATEFLFKNGRSFSEFPFRIIHTLAGTGNNFPAQVLISVPKKKFKKAVDRNRIKRQISAAYRLNKQELYDQIKTLDKGLSLAIIYTSTKEEPYSNISAKIILSLQRLAKLYGQTNELDINKNN